MEQLSLFAQEIEQNAPLASRLRPESLDDYIGQEHLVGKGRILRQMLDTDRITSMCNVRKRTTMNKCRRMFQCLDKIRF